MKLYSCIRPFLFALPPEKAHEFTLAFLDHCPDFLFPKIVQAAPFRALGLDFSHPIGLAAGFDKNGLHLSSLARLGFSFIEVGTVTPKPQSGNPAPRLFRLKKDYALINRMGFNNLGVDALVNQLKKTTYQGILGINIGKNTLTPLNHAVDDYLYCFEALYPYASYITVNLSSPNSPDLRRLQEAIYAERILEALTQARSLRVERGEHFVPLLIKVSPDEEEETLKKLCELILNFRIDGVIACNSTLSRDLNLKDPAALEAGGLSGRPLAAKAKKTLALLKKYLDDSCLLIGAGGIDSVSQLRAFNEAGASLFQLYTGLIYKGPALVHELVASLDGMRYL